MTPSAPRWSLFLLPAILAHQSEEWWGGPGFSVWAGETLGAEITPERFLAINAVGLALFAGALLAAVFARGLAWLAVAVASLLVLNGILHLLLTLGFSTYSPGTITGVLLYLPLGIPLLRSMARSLPRSTFAGAVAAGVVFHALVTLTALS